MKVEHQNKRKEMWINAWSCVACVNPSIATELADEALKDFDERFKEVEDTLLDEGIKFKNEDAPIPNFSEKHIRELNLSKTIKSLKFSTRTYNALEHNKINLVSDLIKCSKNKILKFRNLGYLSLNEIETKLNSLGLKLKQNTSKPEKPKFLQLLNQKAQERGLNLSDYMKILLNETASKEHKAEN